MKALLALVLASLTLSQALADDPVVEPKDAHNYVGKTVIVRGFVGDVLAEKGNLYVNFGRPYPNHDFQAIVPAKSVATVGADLIQNLAGNKASIRGTVEMHENKAEIIVTSADQIVR